jgi:hypothetical protein
MAAEIGASPRSRVPTQAQPPSQRAGGTGRRAAVRARNAAAVLRR